MRPYQARKQAPPRAVSLEVAQRLLDERNELQLEVARLREQNAALLEQLGDTAAAPEPVEAPAQDAVEALARRVAELTRDLERVQHRTAAEVEQARVDERSRLLSRLGDVLDSVERGLAMDLSGGPDAWQTGLRAIEAQLLAFFGAQGATLIGEVGEEYDPSLHEAVAMVDDPTVGPRRVASVLRRGIVLPGGHVARPAQVYVTR